jgi:hypothetical protein
MLSKLGEWRTPEYISAAIRGDGGDYMIQGSENGLLTGTALIRAFKGVTVLSGKVGSRLHFNTDQNYAGLGTASVAGAGVVFNIRQLLAAIGAGQVQFGGANITSFVASSTLSFIKKSGGVYAAGAGTGPFQAGHAQPSAPTIIAKSNPSAGQTEMNGGVSVVIWRVSSITGQISLASLPSNVLLLTNQSVIVQMPSADSNGQNFWGIGVVRIGFDDIGNFYMLPTSLHGEVAESALTTIDGYTRAVEISWTNGALAGQDLAPSKAFPPPAGQFAGVMNDTVWLESDGIIYVGDPGYIGSFPPSNSLFPNEPAVHYLRFSDNLTLRFGTHSIGALVYVGGSPALEYQTLIENQGIVLPQNVALGAAGRLLAWIGRPAVFESDVEPDIEFAARVMPDFLGWEDQDASKPVVPGYDPTSQHEVFCFQKKVMPFYAPMRKWGSPISLVGKINGNIMAAVTFGKRLLLSVSESGSLVIYQFDVGSGSVMKIQTSDISSPDVSDDLSEFYVQFRADNTSNPVVTEVIRNGVDASPILINSSNPANTGLNLRRLTEKAVLNAKIHGMKVTITSAGGDAGLEVARSYGVPSGVKIA